MIGNSGNNKKKSNMNILRLTERIDSYRDLSPSPQRKRTFLEIEGYPQLENVASHILEFYFDPKKEHYLGTTFLERLLSALCLTCEARFGIRFRDTP